LVAPWPRELGLVEATVGAPLTVKQPEQVAGASPSLFVTVKLLAPVVAFEATVILAVSWVELTKLVELTVMPVPENEAVAPFRKLVPLTATFWLVAPWPRELGLAEVAVGPLFTVKQPEQVAGAEPSLFVTLTLRAPVVAPELIVTFAVSWVELTKLVELTVTPVPEKDAVAPFRKLVPLRATFWLVAPWPSAFGFVEVTVGAPLTVKQPEHEPTPVSGFVTVTLRAPVVATELMEMLAVSWVELTKLVELTVMPVPEKDAVAPFTKLVPLTVMFWLVAP
jgi:hypothetical protein